MTKTMRLAGQSSVSFPLQNPSGDGSSPAGYKRVAGLDGVQVLPRIATPGSQRVTTPCRVFPPTLISRKLQINLIPELGTVLPGSMILRKSDIIGTYQKMPCSFRVR